MPEDELELKILQRYVEQHKVASIADPETRDKCLRELSMRDVLQALGSAAGQGLDYDANLWLTRLAPDIVGSHKGPLRRCSNNASRQGEHRYHARAFMDSDRAPAWERIRDLRAILGRSVEPRRDRELEQKFRILFSAAQAAVDFDEWLSSDSAHNVPVAVLFTDIDSFKPFNSRFSETVVDQSLLPDFQRLIERLVRHRGFAYRHGGEEFLILLPNQNLEEGIAFAERLRGITESTVFQVGPEGVRMTVSIGVAAFPMHAAGFAEIVLKANEAEHIAKAAGGNRVVAAQGASA